MKRFVFAAIIGTFIAATLLVSVTPNVEANACARDPTVCQ